MIFPNETLLLLHRFNKDHVFKTLFEFVRTLRYATIIHCLEERVTFKNIE